MRVAVVTGGTRGIGKAISQELKSQGILVAANFRGNDTAARILEQTREIPTFQWDVSDMDACRAGVARVTEHLGPVDILVNNAGITRDVAFHRMTPAQWAEVMATNLTSLYNMCQCVFEGMRQRKFGRIINISSMNGQKGQFGQVNYAAAKAGCLGFTKALALEGAKFGITVNAIAPGYCETDMVAAVPKNILEGIIAAIPIGRLGSPQDVARAAAFLASDQAGFITGSTMAINGGQYMS